MYKRQSRSSTESVTDRTCAASLMASTLPKIVKENIRLGRPGASDEEVFAAARAAQCLSLIHI